MKEYMNEKFWRMFAGFATLLAVSFVLLIIIKIYEGKQIEAGINSASAVINNQ